MNIADYIRTGNLEVDNSIKDKNLNDFIEKNFKNLTNFLKRLDLELHTARRYERLIAGECILYDPPVEAAIKIRPKTALESECILHVIPNWLANKSYSKKEKKIILGFDPDFLIPLNAREINFEKSGAVFVPCMKYARRDTYVPKIIISSKYPGKWP